MTEQTFTDLNEAFGKALLQQFFEPVIIGRGPAGEPFFAPSGVSILAQELYKQQAHKLMSQIWEHVDIDDLAKKVADLVVKELTRPPNGWGDRNIHKDQIAERVKEIVAQQLGQRVVEHLDLHVGQRELPSAEPAK